MIVDRWLCDDFGLPAAILCGNHFKARAVSVVYYKNGAWRDGCTGETLVDGLVLLVAIEYKKRLRKQKDAEILKLCAECIGGSSEELSDFVARLTRLMQ